MEVAIWLPDLTMLGPNNQPESHSTQIYSLYQLEHIQTNTHLFATTRKV